MRRVWIGVSMIIAGCAARARPPEPLPQPVIARDEVPAIPMPAYDGAARIAECAIRLDPASAREQRERMAAIRSRLPVDAKVELAPLGDRAGRIAMAIPVAPKMKEREATHLALDLARDLGLLFGATPRAEVIAIEPPEPSDRSWAIELEAQPIEASEYGGSFRIVMRIDARRGRVEAGVVGEALPAATVCRVARPPFDKARLLAALVGHPPFGRERALGPDDVVDAFLELDVLGGHTVRWIAAVPYGRGLRAAARSPDPEVSWAATEGILLVDPITAELIDTRATPWHGGIDPPPVSAHNDAYNVFGPRSRWR